MGTAILSQPRVSAISIPLLPQNLTWEGQEAAAEDQIRRKTFQRGRETSDIKQRERPGPI